MATRIPDISTSAPQAGVDATPTGFNALTGQSSGKVKGSDADDRGSLTDLQKDKDQVINMGGGDDVFVVNGSESKKAGNVNGIVDMGAGSNDTVVHAYQLSDYKFTLRGDNGIKIQYVGDGDINNDGTPDAVDGAAVTFYNTEFFRFRNINDETGADQLDVVLSYDELRGRIDPNYVPPGGEPDQGDQDAQVAVTGVNHDASTTVVDFL